MKVTHFRIHRANDITWCGRQISGSNLNVVTRTARDMELSAIRWKDGAIDYTPRTAEETEEARREWNSVVSQITCRRCTSNGKNFQEKK